MLVFSDSANRYITGNMDATNMAGVWASVPPGSDYQVVEPAFGARTGTKAWKVSADPLDQNLRATLDNLAATEIYYADAFYLPNLPAGAGRRRIEFCNSSNVLGCYLSFEPSGTIALYNGSDAKIAESSSAVISAGQWTWLQFRIKPGSGTGLIQVRDGSGFTVLSASSLTFGSTIGIIRYRVVYNVSEQTGDMYFSDPSVKDTSGAAQNTWYDGPRFNYLLEPVADDPDSEWDFVARRMYGPGVGQVTTASGNNGWSVADGATLEIGSGEFTIEGTYRWNALPGTGESQYLAAKWLPSSNLSWGLRLYESGGSYFLEFACSTDGTTGGEVVIHDFPWEPVLYQPYVIAVSRTSGVNRLFIDGIRQGPAVADANAYANTTAVVSLAARQASGSTLSQSWNGWMDEFRFTVGVGRYTANYTPDTDAFPRSNVDPYWNSVQLLMGWDTASIDQSQVGRVVTQYGAATQLTTDDGLYAYQSIDKAGRDDTFIEAAYLPASGTVEFIANPTNGSHVVAATDTYTFNTVLGGANSVLIGIDAEATRDHLIAAVNGDAGEGTIYGTGTIANPDVLASAQPGAITYMEASVPGTAGNSLAFTTTVSGAIISGSGTLEGGEDIPGPAEYNLERLPRGVTLVESVSLFTRRSVYGPGSAQIVPSFVDGGNVASSGSETSAPANPGWQVDRFSDNNGTPWSIANLVGAKVTDTRTT